MLSCRRAFAQHHRHDRGARPCLDIAQQLQAVEKAVAQAKKTLIHNHIENCLEEAVGPLPREQRAPVEEFEAITKYL